MATSSKILVVPLKQAAPSGAPSGRRFIMRPPPSALPTSYDAAAIAAHFSDEHGAQALRGRLLLIARAAASGALAVAGSTAMALSSDGNEALRSSSGSTGLRDAIEPLGPTFIKFGQAAANRPDLVGFPIADE